MLSDRLRAAVIAVVTIVWAANFAAGVFVVDYKPSEAINGVFLAIVGGLFAASSRRSDDSGKSDKS